jgi:hypothetical protein
MNTKTIEAIAVVILETITDMGDRGAPSGPMYMSLQAGCGITLETYQQIMNALVSTGRIRRSGHCYFIAKKEAKA